MSDTLNDLLAACRRQEPAAIAQLVARFRPWCMDLATALLTDPHLAEDATQAAFVAALASLGQLQHPSAFPAWLKQIVRTHCHRLARGQRPILQADVQTVTDTPTPADRAAQSELCGIVRAAIAALTPAARDTAELYYLDELPLAAVASQLQVPLGTVKRRLHDARRQLRDRLEDYIRQAPI